MQVRFLSDGSEYRSYGGGSFSKKKDGGGGIFWWAILITLLMGAATFCWFFSIMVFSYPEKPFNYRMLDKFKKLEPLRLYSTYTVPTGKVYNARQLLGECMPYSLEQMSVRNDVLKRAYIRNYKHEQPMYVVGDYHVLSVRRLTPSDVFTNGWVLRARAVDLEDVDIEVVMPGLAKQEAPFTVGETLKMNEVKPQVSALHVQRMGEGRICVTVVPLAYTNFTVAKEVKADKPAAMLTMAPPEKLNMEAYWPVTRDSESKAQVVSKN